MSLPLAAVLPVPFNCILIETHLPVLTPTSTGEGSCRTIVLLPEDRPARSPVDHDQDVDLVPLNQRRIIALEGSVRLQSTEEDDPGLVGVSRPLSSDDDLVEQGEPPILEICSASEVLS